MKTKTRRAALAAATSLTRAALRAPTAFSDSAVQVDAEAGIIRGAAIMVIGPAMGHGFSIDSTTLAQVRDLLNASPGGVKVRFKHPSIISAGDDGSGYEADDLGDVIGRISNARIDGDTLRGDVQLGDYASALPGLGDVRSYLLSRAKQDPAGLGLSAVIGFNPEPITDARGDPTGIVARVTELDAVDFVGRGAATPNGLLSARPDPKPIQPAASDVPAAKKPVTKSQIRRLMNAALKQYLIDNMGLDANASDEDAQAAFDALSPEDQAKAKASMSAPTPAPAAAASQPAAAMSAKNARVQAVTDDGDKLLAMEGRRITQISQLATLLKVPDEVCSLAIAENESVIDAKSRFLKHLSESAKPIRSVKVGSDLRIAALSAAFPDAILKRSGSTVEKPHELAEKFSGLSVLSMFQHYLSAVGVREAFEMSRSQLVELMGPRRFARAFPQYAALAQSTSDFSSILENTMRKSIRIAYQEFPKTWNKWAKRNTTPDFKIVSRPQLSQSPDLVARDEGAPIKYATVTDNKETYRVKEYVSGIKLTRQSLINDDLSAFSSLPQKQAQAAARLEDALAYKVLTDNSTMADGGALFNSTAVTPTGTGHGNLAGTGAVLSVASLEATQKLLRLQKGLGAVGRLNLTARYLLVPVALEVTASQLISSNVDPSKSNQTPNPFSGRFQVFSSPFLDDGSSTAWYLAADAGMIDTVEVCFLTDEPEPVLRQETDFDTEDAKFAVRHTCAAAALDFRGLAKNPGA